MIVAGLQMDIAWEDPEENFGRAAELAKEAAAGGARMVALPEMFATGFSVHSPAVADHADAIRRFLSDLAREYGRSDKRLTAESRLLRVPSGAVLLPLILAAVLQGMGYLTITLPPWLLVLAFAVIGWWGGLRFVRETVL